MISFKGDDGVFDGGLEKFMKQFKLPQSVKNFIVLLPETDYEEMLDYNWFWTKYPEVRFVNRDGFLGKLLRY